jgi:cobyrinic acid a,c-diamide synthase
LETDARPPLADIRPITSSQNTPLIGIIRDTAFQFYYPENIESLEKAGARVTFINAEKDYELPDIDGLYIGGGFQETRAEQLSSNLSFIRSLKHKAEGGLPIYAECGGLMYLGEAIIWNGRSFPMTGILPWQFVTGKKPVGHGYSVIEAVRDTPFFKKGTRLTGHEFHYSRPEPATPEDRTNAIYSCKVLRGNGFTDKMEGISRKNIFGTYTHIHVLDNLFWAENMVKAALRYAKSRSKHQ